jgi:hypothetical protein
MRSVSRREFGAIASTVLVALGLGAACRLAGEASVARAGRLSARPKTNVTTSAAGTQGSWWTVRCRTNRGSLCRTERPTRFFPSIDEVPPDIAGEGIAFVAEKVGTK